MNIDWGMVGAVGTIIGIIVAVVGIVKGNGDSKKIKKVNKQKVGGFIVSNNEIKQENNK